MICIAIHKPVPRHYKYVRNCVSERLISGCYRAGRIIRSKLYLPAPTKVKNTARARKSSAFSLRIKGSAACRINAATNIVIPRAKDAGRVISPKAISIPPPNSDSPAAHENKWGAGKPISAMPLVNPSDGGILPTPWPNAILKPVKIRRTASPILAAKE